MFATGFTMIADLAFGADRSLYVLENDSNGFGSPGNAGALWEVAANGSRTLVFGDLVFPTGLEIGADGAFYVSNAGRSSGRGEVVRIAAAVPEPGSYALMLVGLSAVGLLRGARRRSRAR